jgi:hypothetical protein
MIKYYAMKDFSDTDMCSRGVVPWTVASWYWAHGMCYLP